MIEIGNHPTMRHTSGRWKRRNALSEKLEDEVGERHHYSQLSVHSPLVILVVRGSFIALGRELMNKGVHFKPTLEPHARMHESSVRLGASMTVK